MSEQHQMRSVAMVLFAMALLVTAVVSLFVIGGEDINPDTEHVGGDFTLQSSSGSVSLKQFRGKAVLLFFGYTHCPDVCPTTMSNLSETLDLLSEREREKVQPLFITVDPLRDSVEHLAKYVAFFHPKIIGLSGTTDEIKSVAQKYTVEYFKDGEESEADKYLISHTSYLFLINPEGEVSDLMSDHTSPADIADALRQYISR
ncbi:MAG: SCO family protein [Mariprofundaceae bacterium]